MEFGRGMLRGGLQLIQVGGSLGCKIQTPLEINR